MSSQIPGPHYWDLACFFEIASNLILTVNILQTSPLQHCIYLRTYMYYMHAWCIIRSVLFKFLVFSFVTVIKVSHKVMSLITRKVHGLYCKTFLVSHMHNKISGSKNHVCLCLIRRTTYWTFEYMNHAACFTVSVVKTMIPVVFNGR